MKGYKGPARLPDGAVRTTVGELFVTQEMEAYQLPPRVATRGSLTYPPLTVGELGAALSRFGSKKAPGLDQTPVGILRMLYEVQPYSMLPVYQTCLEHTCFPSIWKIQKLILLPKGEVEASGPQKYRSISLMQPWARS